MSTTINAKQMRADLPDLVKRIGKGESFTVLYRSRPAFKLVPVNNLLASDLPQLENDPLYQAPPLGASGKKHLAAEHDRHLYQ